MRFIQLLLVLFICLLLTIVQSVNINYNDPEYWLVMADMSAYQEERIVTAAVGITIPFRNKCHPPRRMDKKGNCKIVWRH